MTLDLQKALDVARSAAQAAAKVALPYFERGVAVERKADRSEVTEADRASERAIVQIISEAFPEHGILGEEGGQQREHPDARWIVDPLDGTRGFTRGGKFWGPLIALQWKGEIVAGAMALPALGQQYWAAKGMGAYRDGNRLSVSSISSWEDATLSVGELGKILGSDRGPAVNALIQSCASTRGYGDLAGCALVLEGQAEVFIEGGVQVWDLAPLRILIEEAGGRYSNWDGVDELERGEALISNGHVHDHVLERFKV